VEKAVLNAHWGQWRKRKERLRAMKPEKLSQRASRDEEEGNRLNGRGRAEECGSYNGGRVPSSVQNRF